MNREAEKLKYHSETGANSQTDTRCQPPPLSRTRVRSMNLPPLPRCMYPKCGNLCGQKEQEAGARMSHICPRWDLSCTPCTPPPQGESVIIFKDPACRKVVPSTSTSTFPNVEGSKHLLLAPTFFIKQKLGRRPVGSKVEV